VTIELKENPREGDLPEHVYTPASVISNSEIVSVEPDGMEGTKRPPVRGCPMKLHVITVSGLKVQIILHVTLTRLSHFSMRNK